VCSPVGVILTRNLRSTAAGCVGILLFTFTGVSAAASTGSVPKTVVEAQAAKVLAQETGLKPQPPIVTCPGDLKGQVGASIHCTLRPAGSRLVYPVKVTVNSVKNGTAHFYVHVGQAFGVADKAEFCHDNAVLDRATSVAKTVADLVPIFIANEKTLLDLQATAPPKIVVSAGTLVHAAKDAMNSGNASAFTTRSLTNAGQAVDTFCGQKADGSPVGSPPTTAG
jgi:Domain of unknown function (DUF4333)